MLVVSGEGCNAAHTEGTESKFKLAGPQGWLPKLIVNCNISNQLYLFDHSNGGFHLHYFEFIFKLIRSQSNIK